MHRIHRIKIIDSHTGGEPTRLVVDGFPDLGTGSMAERRARLAAEHDRWRTATVLEPRGNDVIVGALLCPPVDARNAAGVVFFNNSGYLGMCGHGTIGVVASLAHMGRIQPGVHGIETPVGTVQTTLHDDGSVSVRNVPAYRLHHQLTVQVPGHGPVTGDVAWGGNWFFLITKHQQRVASNNLAALTAFALAVQQALADQGVRGSDGGARPAAPAPAPSWPAWRRTAACSRARSGARPASSAASSKPATRWKATSSSPPCAAAPS